MPIPIVYRDPFGMLCRRQRILFIDADPGRQAAFRRLAAEHHVDVVATARRALSYLRREPYDTVYLHHGKEQCRVARAVTSGPLRQRLRHRGTFFLVHSDERNRGPDLVGAIRGLRGQAAMWMPFRSLLSTGLLLVAADEV